jgi:LacI family transcriptional regulator
VPDPKSVQILLLRLTANPIGRLALLTSKTFRIMHRGGEEAVTLKELAAQLGLSITTVSRALNGYDDVAPTTRERIFATASRMGYAPNISAQRLITGRVQAVGVVLPLPAGRFADPFFFEMMIGLGEVLRTRSLELVISAAEPG